MSVLIHCGIGGGYRPAPGDQDRNPGSLTRGEAMPGQATAPALFRFIIITSLTSVGLSLMFKIYVNAVNSFNTDSKALIANNACWWVRRKLGSWTRRLRSLWASQRYWRLIIWSGLMSISSYPIGSHAKQEHIYSSFYTSFSVKIR